MMLSGIAQVSVTALFDHGEHTIQTAKITHPSGRMKLLASLLASLCAFFLGIVVTLFASMHVMAPGSAAECPSPCDGPAYAGLGLELFAGPVIGASMAWLTFRMLHRWRASTGA